MNTHRRIEISLVLSCLLAGPVMSGNPAGFSDRAGISYQQIHAARAKRNAAGTRIDKVLLVMAQQAAAAQSKPFPDHLILDAATSQDAAAMVMMDTHGLVGVRVYADRIEKIEGDLSDMGMKSFQKAKGYEFGEGFFPAESLLSLDTLVPQGLRAVVPIYKPNLNTGSVTAQCDSLHEADRVRALAPGFDGTGLHIGVMSDSYGNIAGGVAAGVGSGDLPTTLVFNSDLASGGTDEGRAMMEIVHDIAPAAAKSYATAFGSGEVGFAANISALAGAGCNIIVDDVNYFLEPMFQDGVVAQAAIDAFNNDDVNYFSSAGNMARQAYESTNFATAVDATFGNCHDFDPGPGVDTRQRVTFAAGATMRAALMWDDPWYTAAGVDTDVDILLVAIDGSNAVYVSSTADNLLSQQPAEFLGATAGGAISADLVIQLVAGPAPSRIKYVNYKLGTVTINEFDTQSSTVNPHAAAAEVAGVGAINYYEQELVVNFSSRGPSIFHFDAAGNPLGATETRQTPRFSALQGVDTTFFGSDAEPNGFPNFFGTSAAAPAAAAICALVREAHPADDAGAIFARMDASVQDIGAAGYDNDSGLGQINAFTAVYGPGESTPGVPDYFEGGEATVLGTPWRTRATMDHRILVTTGGTPATGSWHLVLDSTFNGIFSGRSEATLYLDLSGVSGTTLTFNHKENSDDDNPMSASFVTAEDSDGIAMSVDGGVTWNRLISLTGAASTNIYTPYMFDLDAIALGLGLTLGDDVRIRFQQVGNAQFASGTEGFAFDDIFVTSLVLWVNLTSFHAGTDGPGQPVEVAWTTASETDNVGFNLYRAHDIGNSWQPGERVNTDMIAAAGSPTSGSTYGYTDQEGYDPSQTRGYFLEDVDLNGASHFHGPVFVNNFTPVARICDWSLY